MYKRIFLLLCFCLSFQLFAQTPKLKPVLYDEFTHNLLKSFDVLYVADNREKEYVATWLLLNMQLYLCVVHFPFEGKRDDKIVYRPMEKFTGIRFNKKNIPDIEMAEWIYGLMPATWFTDTLYVKKANSETAPLYREECRSQELQEGISSSPCIES